MRHVGPMAQEVAEVFPDKVVDVGGALYIRLDDLPLGITPYDLARPVVEADYPAAMMRWQKVFDHWRKKL